MDISCMKGDILATSADLIVVGMYRNESLENDFVSRLDDLLAGRLKKDAKAADFTGRAGQSMLFPASDQVPASYILVVGLGELSESSKQVARAACGLAVQTAQKLNARTMALELIGEDHEAFRAQDNAQAMSEALLLASYSFDTYKKKQKRIELKSVVLIAEDGRDARKAQKGIETAQTIADGVTVARDLVNTPAQDMKPIRLAQAAEQIAKMSSGSVKVRVFNREQCEKKKMGSYLAVAQGSDAEPRFIHLSYKPQGRSKKTIALVGKGVTFDSGGLSLKPGKGMETMKCDMAGAAAVLGTFATLARLKPSVEVHGIVAATENMPSGKAIRPGDVVRAMNGKSIEILNTDAEGRLTMADSLGYACKLSPDYVVDLATLTGAAVVALGEEISAVMSNDAVLANQIVSAGSESGETIWEMPLYAPYRKLMDSEVADIRNISITRYGGSLTAGLFLQDFIEEGQKWAHMDIAGPAFAERPIGTYLGKGGTGFGVRTLTTWIQSI